MSYRFEDIELSWEQGSWDCGTAENSKKGDREMKDEMEWICMGGRKPCEETGKKGESDIGKTAASDGLK